MKRSKTAGLLMVVLIALTAFGLAAPAANADDSYTGTCMITLTPTSVTPGQTVTVTASGFNAGALVTFTISPNSLVMGTATADSKGVATLDWAVPADFPLGSHMVNADGDGCSDPANVAELTVVSAVSQTQPASGTLPRTGNDYSNLLRIGILLIAAGGLVVLATRKRSSQSV